MMFPNYRCRSLILLILVYGFIASCGSVASVTPTVYTQEKLQEVDIWRIDFKYEPGRVERKAEASGDAEVKMVTEGRSPQDLQLRDDIFYSLQDKHGIKLVKDSAPLVGIISIHPVHFNLGGFKSLDVTLVASTGETMARIRIKNGDCAGTFVEDDLFAAYSADAIADVIKGRKK